MTSSVNQHAAALERICQRYDADIKALAERVRTEVVVPLCRRYRLTFTSGMGMFTFQRRDVKSVIGIGGDAPLYNRMEDLDTKYVVGGYGLSKWAKAALSPVLKLLCSEVYSDNGGHELGHYVSDVD